MPTTAAGPSAAPIAPADFAPYRRHYVARQHAMVASIGPLRSHLRTTLAARSPAMARLAAVDEVMDQWLGPHERRLLAGAPARLEKHFERLREDDTAARDDAGPEGGAEGGRPGNWLEMFGKDMQDMLLAELEVRMQPVEGLIEALRVGVPR